MTMRLTAALLLTLLAACTTRQAPLEPIASDARVLIKTEFSAKPQRPINDDDFVMGAAAWGTAGGALIGTLASATCGPFYMLCVPFTGAIGATAGFFAGGIFGAVTAINAEEREKFTLIIASVFESNGPEQGFQQAFEELAVRRWTLVDEHPDQVICLQLDEFKIIQHSPDRYSLAYSATFTITSPALENAKSPPTYRYSHVTPSRQLEFFLDGTGKNFSAEFSRGLASLVSQMANSL